MSAAEEEHGNGAKNCTNQPGHTGVAGTLFQYFKKKDDPTKPSTAGVRYEVTEGADSISTGIEGKKNDTSSPKGSKDNENASFNSAPCEKAQARDLTCLQKHESSLTEKKDKQTSFTTEQNCKNDKSKEASHAAIIVNTVNKGFETDSCLPRGTKKQSQNPFQIMMESGKKKGVWDKPITKTKEPGDQSSEDECTEVESEVPVRSAVQTESTQFFSIFTKNAGKDSVDTSLNRDTNRAIPTKGAVVKKSAKQSEPLRSSAVKNKATKAVLGSSLDVNKTSKKSMALGSTSKKDAKNISEKTRNHEVPSDRKDESFSATRKSNREKSDDKDATNVHQSKSHPKGISDSDFEADAMPNGKRKDHSPSKPEGSNRKRPRTASTPLGDADSSSKSDTVTAAQKLVKRSRNQKKRGSDGSRRDSAPINKPGTKQTLITAGQKVGNAQPVNANGKSDVSSPLRRSSRPKPERRLLPSDSELEFTPGRKAKSRRRETECLEADRTPGRRSERKRSRVKPAGEVSGSELEATPVKKPAKRVSAGGRRKQSGRRDVEVLSTKKKSRHSSAEVVEISSEERPAQRRSSRPRRPVVFSDSEVEPSPIKKPSRRSRPSHGSARPATPTDSEAEVTPVKRPPRRSSRAVRRLSDSEVEVSPLKKPSRGGGRRSRAAGAGDDPEVVLVRSSSAGPAGTRSGRPGVDAFQVLQRSGRPPKQTAAEKAATEARRAFLASGVPQSLQVQAEVARRLEESLTPLFPEVSHVHQRGGQGAAPLSETPALPFGLSWGTGPPLPPVPVRPVSAGGLVPGLAVRVGKSAGSARLDGGRGDDTGAGDVGADSLVKPAASTASGDVGESAAVSAADSVPPASASPVACLPCLSSPECAASLRQLLAADRDSSAGSVPVPAPSAAPAAPAPTGPSLWTDRFRPRHHGSFVGDSLPAEELQEWLAEWSAPSAGGGWHDDGSEEPAGDGTVLLLGPTGCGKTSAVYAAAAQLGFQVLEVSASSRRSGRHLSSQLSEATQSQRVSLPGGGTAAVEPPSRSLLLLEDVQLVSEELDDGFLAAAASLAATAKRPVVLTSCDPALARTRLLRALPHRLLAAAAPPAAALGSRLALVALAQGWLLSAAAAARLAEGGDARRALLQLQWLCEGQGDRAEEETVDTRQALTEAQLETAEEFVDQLPAVLKVVRLDGEPGRPEVPGLTAEPVGRRESDWRPPVRETAAGYDGQTRRRWRCVDPDLFSDEDDVRPGPSPTPTPVAAVEVASDGATREPESEPAPPEERALLSASVAALADLYDVRSACDALVTPAERQVMGSWWQRRPEADMAEAEQPRCVAEEDGELLGWQLVEEVLRAAAGRCAGQLRAARADFSASGRPEPAGLCLPVYEEEGVREAAWEEGCRLAPAVPSLLLSRRAATTDLLPSIRCMCRLECGRQATDGGRTRRFLHYFDQMGLHAVPTGLRTLVCKSLM